MVWLVAVVCFFFFFQAEDGIRDIGVTGVQTCALPISPKALRTSCCRGAPSAGGGSRARARRARLPRSEERRVGKECRSRGSADELEKKDGQSRCRHDEL